MIDFGIKDAIDILLVALILYYIYRLMKQSSAANIFSGIIMFILVWILVSQVFEMRLLGTILDKMVNMKYAGFSLPSAHSATRASFRVSSSAAAKTRPSVPKSCPS